MPTTLQIPLKDIALSTEGSLDLASMPQDQAAAKIKAAYSFLGPALTVEILMSSALLSLPAHPPHVVAEAQRTYDRAVRAGERGEYARAIPLFQQVLEILPTHVDARRNLGMAYLESGDVERARDHLIETLMIRPRDTWTYILLGNIYLKQDDIQRAEDLYRTAMEINPRDPALLTNYGVLMLDRHNPEQAEAFFEQAIEARPSYPNPYHGLALLALNQGDPADALAHLDGLFDKADPPDARTQELYAQARQTYLKASQAQADATVTEAMAVVERRRRSLEEQGGVPIRLTRDDSLDTSARIEISWRRGRDHHVIKYRNRLPAAVPHLIAHELDHLALELDARAAGRNRLFASTSATLDHAGRAIRSQTAQLRHLGLTEQSLASFVHTLATGLSLQLYNTPLDMIIEHRLYYGEPLLRPSQFVSLHAMYAEALPALTNPDIKRDSPRDVWRANVALNCAMALFYDHLYAGRTAWAEPYRKSSVFDTGRRLFDLWLDAFDTLRPGDEYALVDEFATVLRLDCWYEWAPDAGAELVENDEGTSMEAITDRALLEAKEPAAVMHCLSALQRFDRMTDDQVRTIAYEIALVGQRGLDYADPEPKYTLSSLPRERFSGLQLMCLMYVGLKRVDPVIDLEMPLHDAYLTALRLHKSDS